MDILWGWKILFFRFEDLFHGSDGSQIGFPIIEMFDEKGHIRIFCRCAFRIMADIQNPPGAGNFGKVERQFISQFDIFYDIFLLLPTENGCVKKHSLRAVPPGRQR